MTELDKFFIELVVLFVKQIPSAMAGAAAMLLIVGVSLRKKYAPTMMEAKDQAGASLYVLLQRDNERLAKMVENLGQEIRRIKKTHALEIEHLQRQVLDERESCSKQMQTLRLEINALRDTQNTATRTLNPNT